MIPVDYVVKSLIRHDTRKLQWLFNREKQAQKMCFHFAPKDVSRIEWGETPHEHLKKKSLMFFKGKAVIMLRNILRNLQQHNNNLSPLFV